MCGKEGGREGVDVRRRVMGEGEGEGEAEKEVGGKGTRRWEE